MRQLTLLLSTVVAWSVLVSGQTTVGRIGANLPKSGMIGGGGNTCTSTSAQITYVGSARLPFISGAHGSTNGLQYGGYGFALNTSGNGGAGSLFISGSVANNESFKFAEFAIPTFIQGDHPSGGSTNLATLNIASCCLQDFSDISNGLFPDGWFTGANSVIGGAAIYDGKLYASIYLNYDASHETHVSHLRHGLTLSTADAFAWETVRSSSVASANDLGTAVGMLAGAISDVPSSLQASFGGPVVGGLCCGISIITRTSRGPAMFAFDPAQIGSDTPSSIGNSASSSPVAATPLIYYDAAHLTLGDWTDAPGSGLPADHTQTASTHPWWSWMDGIGGLIIEDNCVFIPEVYGVGHAPNPTNGNVDTPTAFYGNSTTDWTLNGTVCCSGSHLYAYDPTGTVGTEGQHGWPYDYRIVVYDVNDIITAKSAGTPWSVVPVRKFDFPMPFDQLDHLGASGTSGANRYLRSAYWRANRDLYVLQIGSPDWIGSFSPMLHKFHIAPPS